MPPTGHLEYAFVFGCISTSTQAKVLREQHPDLGPHHVDTALAHHNLGCCLDRLGHCHLALRLLAGAADTFRVVLGNAHPRTATACRNLAHVQHRLVRLDLKYKSVAQVGGRFVLGLRALVCIDTTAVLACGLGPNQPAGRLDKYTFVAQCWRGMLAS